MGLPHIQCNINELTFCTKNFAKPRVDVNNSYRSNKNLKPFYMIRKLKFLPLLFAFVGLLSCNTSQVSNASTHGVGMVKVAILYPNGDDKTFDMDYYENICLW